jgi:hypothetical protein
MSTLKQYFQNAAAAYNPATLRGAWDSSTGLNKYALGGAVSGAYGSNTTTVNSANADWDWAGTRHISSPLATDMDFSGAISGVIGAVELHADVNAKLHLHVFVLAGQTDTVRGTLWADYIDSTELTTSYVGVAFSGTLSDLSALAGDSLVVEAGARTNATTTASYFRVARGCTNGTDLSAGADMATYPGWIQLAYTVPATGCPKMTDHFARLRR